MPSKPHARAVLVLGLTLVALHVAGCIGDDTGLRAPNTGGSAGTSGTGGESGANGTSGTSGATGASGLGGASGTAGVSGANGTAGAAGTGPNGATCDELVPGFSFDAAFAQSVGVELATVFQATADLALLAEQLRIDAGTACRHIAQAGGHIADVTWDGTGTPSDDLVKQACDTATSAIIEAANGAGATAITIAFTKSGGRCEADIQGQSECDSTCSGDTTCLGGFPSASCNGQVHCDGACSVDGACVGTPDNRVACEGTCAGECVGTTTGGCTGICVGMCNGQTASDQLGACTGTCDGRCSQLTAPAICTGQCSDACSLTPSNVACTGETECDGTCEGTASCDGTLAPPLCSASGACQAACQISGQSKATCVAPEIVYAIDGPGKTTDAAFFAVLSAEIATLQRIANFQGSAATQVFVSGVGTMRSALQNAVVSGGKTSACGTVALDLLMAAPNSITASVNVAAGVSPDGSNTP